MSRKATIAFNECENAIGHATAHLDNADRLEVYGSLITSWQATVAELSKAACERCGGDGIDPDADYHDFGQGPEPQPRPCKVCGSTPETPVECPHERVNADYRGDVWCADPKCGQQVFNR